MAWTAPMTAAFEATLTAAEWNAQIRDNFQETEVARASAEGQYFTSNGANSIQARSSASHFIGTRQTTGSTVYTNLPTVGPLVTVNVGSAALVWINAGMNTNQTNALMAISFDVSGATDIPASDERAAIVSGIGQNNDFVNSPGDNQMRRGICHMVELNPGIHTFRMRYRAGAGTAHFNNREIVVLPL